MAPIWLLLWKLSAGTSLGVISCVWGKKRWGLPRALFKPEPPLICGLSGSYVSVYILYHCQNRDPLSPTSLAQSPLKPTTTTGQSVQRNSEHESPYILEEKLYRTVKKKKVRVNGVERVWKETKTRPLNELRSLHNKSTEQHVVEKRAWLHAFQKAPR